MKTKKYTIEIILDDAGKEVMTRSNRGFSIIELVGLMHYTLRDLNKICDGAIKPDIVELKIIKEI